MKQLGIVFGAFDLLVTPEGRTVFLEVNEAGQFLFVDHLQPKARLLDAFAEFIVNPSAEFVPSFKQRPVDVGQLWVDPAFQQRLEEDAARHLDSPAPWIAQKAQ